MRVKIMKQLIVNFSTSIREAMQSLDKNAEKCLLVVDNHLKLLGTLTDGDIRRSILMGENLSEDISNSYNKHPLIVTQDMYDEGMLRDIFTNKKINLIPIVDKENRLVDYVAWSQIGGIKKDEGALFGVPVVVMAGGKGTRMEPFTSVLPKPLLPINGTPIIEHIIESFTSVGCENFYLTVNYKKKIMKAYFDELQPGYQVNFVEESDFLGTAGSLKLLDGEFDKPFFVTNCDIIVRATYENIYQFHQDGDYDITLVASTKEYVIPYGTCELDQDGSLSHINEKPKYDFLINTGLYIINPQVLKFIPDDKFYHITHLIEDVKNNGMKVGVFPVSENSWIDVGQWSEYKSTIEKMK
jgi:dTDP-glucose pyrophosphorylase/CBS domain-containing protein